MEKDYITITGMQHYFGTTVFKVGDKFFVKVCFVTGGSVIAEVVNKEVKIHKSNRKIRK